MSLLVTLVLICTDQFVVLSKNITESESKVPYPQLELTLSGFEMKSCRTDLVTASSATLSSVHVLVHRSGKFEV